MKNCLRLIFKREKIDWLDEQPYIGKYFFYKLKRLIMRIIFRIWQNVDEHLLEKYFAEIKFNNKLQKDKRFEAYMPFIILCRNRIEAEDVIGQINNELTSRYNFQITALRVSERPISDVTLENEKEKISNGAKGKTIGMMDFTSYVGKKAESALMPLIPESFKEGGLPPGNFKTNTTSINFQIIRDTKHHLLQHENYPVFLTFIENED